MTPDLTEAVERLKALLEKATPGPWYVSQFEVGTGGDNRMLMGADRFAIGYINGRTADENDNDAALIVAAINALPLHLAALSTQSPVGEDHQWSHDVLHDLVMLRAEEWVLSGGGPGIKERWEKAWRAAEEIFEP